MPAFADDSGLAVDALDGEPGIHSARWAGPDKDFRLAMNKIQSLLIERGAKSAGAAGAAHFVSALCVAWPDGHVEEFEAHGRRHAGLAAARQPGLRLRSDVPAGRPRPAPSARCRPRRSTACRRMAAGCRTAPAPSSSSRRRVLQSADAEAFGVYVHWPFCLSKCPYCDFNSHVRHAAIDEPRFLRAFEAEIAATAARVARPHRVEHLLRRRHAVADAARDRRRDPRRHRQALDASPPTSRSRSKPIRPASRRRAFAAIARPASTACRSACRRSTTRR